MAEPMYGPPGTPIEVVPVVVLSQVFPARPSSIPDIRDFVRRCLAESPLTEDGTREVGETVFRALLDAAGPTGSIQVAFRIFPEHVEVDVLHSDTAIPSPVIPGPPVTHQRSGPAGPAGQGAPPGAGAPAGTGAAAQGPASWPVQGPAHWPVPGPAQGPAQSAPPWRQSAGPAAGALRAVRGPHPGEQGQPDAGRGANGRGQAAAEPAGSGQGGGQAPPEQPPADPAGTFAEWMSSALRREGLTQEAAARQLGVSVKTVSRWVGGATEPRMRDLRRIQEVFGEVPLP